jgi:hypothetical protein
MRQDIKQNFQQIYNQDYSYHPGRQKPQYQKAQIDKAFKTSEIRANLSLGLLQSSEKTNL